MNNNDLFEVVYWPDVQLLFSKPDFSANAVLINNKEMYDEYGSSAYLVRTSWLNKNKLTTRKK
jgi:hypothetical protein